MAHLAQNEFFNEMAKRFSDAISQAQTILEIGSQNINGSVRKFFPSHASYLGIDIGAGIDVDLVIPGELLQLPDGWADIAVSTECFEHAQNWHQVFLNMIRCTKENGLILITCAGLGRPAHGTSDTELGSSPFTTNYYLNLDPVDICQSIKMGRYFQRHGFEVNSLSCDTYFWGVRTSDASDLEFIDLEDALARARGQIGKMARTIAQQSSEIKYKKETILKKYMLKIVYGIAGMERKMKQAIKDLLT